MSCILKSWPSNSWLCIVRCRVFCFDLPSCEVMLLEPARMLPDRNGSAAASSGGSLRVAASFLSLHQYCTIQRCPG